MFKHSITKEEIQDRLKVSDFQSMLIMELLNWDDDVDILAWLRERAPVTYQWHEECYHKPDQDSLAFAAIDEIIGNYGIEALDREENAMFPRYEYSNSGDTYKATFIRDVYNNEVWIGDWGSIVEGWDEESE